MNVTVTTCRGCPFCGGGARRTCNLRTYLPLHDSDNQRDPGCPLNDGEVTIRGDDPEWLKKLKEAR